MPRYRRLAQVTLNVTDLARSRAFYAALPGLAIDRPESGSGAAFRVGTEETRLVLSASATPGLKRFAFAVESACDLDELAGLLERHEVKWRPLPGGAGLRMIDPHWRAAVDFCVEPNVIPIETPRDAILGIGHLVLRSDAYRDCVAFWRNVLGFRVSDEIDERISFLRCFPNPLHHSLAIGQARRPAFHHLNFRAAEAFDIARAARQLADGGIEVVCGPGRHTPTGSRYVYFLDPDGLTLEVSAGTEYFEEHAARAPRVLADRPESFDVAGTPRDPRMYVVGEIEEAGVESG
jgi:2,3-dihydroxy-p-cumate/2,3-dihydroxybenzoate 3,4-dioxygenase